MQTRDNTLRTLIKRMRTAGKNCTVLGIGPVSDVVVKAAFEACKQYNCPPIFIASRNQVDLESLGYGYLMGGIDQKAFVKLIEDTQKKVGYEGPIYICRDHGGPWQRNVELDEIYPVEKAMAIAKESFKADIEAGFNYIHIDPTKCPHQFSQHHLCDWTTDLLEYCEQQRKLFGKDPIDYEVGTEDIQGGLTTDETFEAFLENLTKMLNEKNLPLPTCIVGQTGTLCKIDRNVGCFDKEQTSRLVKIASKYDMGLKEHNGDYMTEAHCRVHPEIGVAGMNVAPEFGLVETDALLHLADLETKLVQDDIIKSEEVSNLKQLFIEKTFLTSPWQKWMTDDIKKLSNQTIESDTAIRLLIARVCGHYVYDLTDIKDSRLKLYENIAKFEVDNDAERFVIDKVKSSIEFYIKNFQLEGSLALT